MDNFFAKVDDTDASLWIETAGLIVFMSLVFLIPAVIF